MSASAPGGVPPEVPAAVPWYRTGLGDALLDVRRLLLVVVALVAVQVTLRVGLAPAGTFADRRVAAGAVAVLVLVPLLLVAAGGRRRRAPAVVVGGAAAALLAVDVVVLDQTAGTAVYGQGLFVATGVGLACLGLLAVRPLGAVVVVGGLHAALLLGASLVRDADDLGPALARGVEVAAASLVPVAAAAAYLALVARLTTARRAADAVVLREEAQRLAAARAAEEGAARLAAARADVGPLLERVVAGVPLPLPPDAAAEARAGARRLRARLVHGGGGTWLEEAVLAEDASAAVVVRSAGGDAPAHLHAPLLALVRRAVARGADLSVTLVPGGAVLAVRGDPGLRADDVAEDLRADLGSPPWVVEGDLLVLEVGVP
ncbi:hypothetical protein [Pseudokineococcus lusitanus]|uniref:Uncharacterized protein n=1 Tax=Pseudokineococcus lusitanus TaxID=763993 RepID=A0A3N1HJX5_9ACTN|nr:hypothetical protein [Pseudokineococcus lusitanus]ROP42838.1 hypothetical protein EDC03_2125 [Pseudokineococcus lusitanus]